MEKNKAGKGNGSDDDGVCGVLNKAIEEKTTFLQKSEGGEGVSQADISEGAFYTEETAGAKALRWVQCLACLKNGKMTIVARGGGEAGGNQKE